MKSSILILIFLFCFSSASANFPSCVDLLNSPPNTEQSLNSILNSVSIERNSVHPDLVGAMEISQLRDGETVFLYLPRIKSQKTWANDFPKVVKVKVLFNDSSKNRITLESVILGLNRTFNYVDLFGSIFRRSDFLQRSIFDSGELVQLGFPGQSEDLRILNLETMTFDTIDRNSLPWIFYFVRAISIDEYEVEANLLEEGLRRFRVKSSEVHQLHTGTQSNFDEMLSSLLLIETTFQVGDLVRVRNENGQMQLKTFDESDFASPTQVYNYWGYSESVTGDIYIDYPGASISVDQSKNLTSLKDAAALISNHPDFIYSTFIGKLDFLMKLQDIFLPWRRAGNTLEVSGINNFDQVLCAGVAVCRHKVPLVASFLIEAGVHFRVMGVSYSEINEDGFGGHTWLEVLNEDSSWIVLDPSNGVLKPMSDSVADAANNYDSYDYRWYQNPLAFTLFSFGV